MTNLSILGKVINEFSCTQSFRHIHSICNHVIMKQEPLSLHGCNSGKSSIQQLTTDIFQAMKTSISFHQHFHLVTSRDGVIQQDARFYMCSRSCTRVFSEPTYGLKVSFVYVYKTRLLLYKATTLHGVRKRLEFLLSFG